MSSDVLSLIGRLPDGIVRHAFSVLKRLRKELEGKNAIARVRERREDFTGVFTDGSNSISERRGAGVAVVAATALRYECSPHGIEEVQVREFSPASGLIVLLPRAYLVTRANTLMRAIEHLTTADLVETGDLVVMDGSYISSLLDPCAAASWVSRELQSAIFSHFAREKGRAVAISKLADAMLALVEVLDGSVTRHMDRTFSKSTAEEIFAEFRDNYYIWAGELYEELLANYGDLFPEESLIALQNFIILFLEQNFTACALARLLETVRRKRGAIVWVCKDSESRMLTKRHHMIVWSNDVSALDFVLNDGEYVLLERAVQLRPVTTNEATIVEALTGRDMLVREIHRIVREQRAKTYALTSRIARRLYDQFGAYSGVYVKFRHLVVQVSYPRALVSDIDRVLGLLSEISPRGYPEPLVKAHHRVVLSQRLAEKLADGMWELMKDDDNLRFLANLVCDSGRRLIGL